MFVSKRRVEYISIKKLEFYTKETIKIFNIVLISIGFIIAIILIKYKPMYEVKIQGTTIGYVENKKTISETTLYRIIDSYDYKINNAKLTGK